MTMPTDSQTRKEWTAIDLARRFHTLYEALAPQFGYETRKESAKPWSQVPEQNKDLMIAVCEALLKELPSPQVAYAAGRSAGLDEAAQLLNCGINPIEISRELHTKAKSLGYVPTCDEGIVAALLAGRAAILKRKEGQQ